MMLRWALPLVSGIAALAVLVGLAERRFRRVRRQLIGREDEFLPDRPTRPSPLVEAAQCGSRANDGHSGHRLLTDGPDALAARLSLAQAAVNTLDLQYYTWHDDLAGLILARAVLRAAARGVRVRILLDDLNARSTRRLVRLLAAHPRITLRVYNPSVTRSAYFLNWLFSFQRLNRRMHNKAMIADGAAAIIGGRNIGDVYFGLSTNLNFRDLDVLTIGPAAKGAEAAFERFWASEFAMPSAAFGVRERADAAEVNGMLARLDGGIHDRLHQRGMRGERHPRRDAALAERKPDTNLLVSDLVWARSSVLNDEPGEDGGDGRLRQELWNRLGYIETSLDIEAGYLIPDDEDMRRFRGLTARGVAVRILTNSLSTNDVVAAQVAYARHRQEVLAAGVELYELQPGARVRRALSLLGSSGSAGLHSKVLLADERVSAIGSFNLDPRSAAHNTEMVLLIESELFGRELATTMRQMRLPSQSYRVELRGRKLIWRRRGVLTSEPGTTLPARALALLIRVLPVERLL